MRSLLLLFCVPTWVQGFTQEISINNQFQFVDSVFKNTPLLNEDIHSLLVQKEGKLLGEFYYNGFTSDSLNNIKSITKSVIGLLIGIAIDQKFIRNTSVPVLSYFDECDSKSESFKEKKIITIEHLLQMQSGIEWNNRALIKDEWWFNEDPHCFLINEFPMDTIPGVHFSYNSAAAHLLSGVVSRASGMSTQEFAVNYLFDPLGINEFYWESDSKNEARGNSELYLKPRDMLKIGQMLLDEGSYGNSRIISKDWIYETLAKAYDATSLMDYGYLWMTSKEGQTPFFFFTGGSGGHHIFVVPEKEMVVVTTGHWDNARSTQAIMQVAVRFIIQEL